ncbi:hypothetical protein [Polynucleobacter sp.]|uniref:hypothetical protein n=1 Tax=Polynucleobacter sp. TaxID=2029855 RepID=UPI003F69A6EC
MLNKKIFSYEFHHEMGRSYLEAMKWLVADENLKHAKHKQFLLHATMDSVFNFRDHLILNDEDKQALEALKRYPKVVIQMKAYMILHNSDDLEAWIWATEKSRSNRHD